MMVPMTRPIVTLQVGISIVLLLAGAVSAQTPDPPASELRIEELERRVRELESRLRELEAAAAKLPFAPASAAVDPPAAQQTVPSLGPPRSSEESTAVSRTGPISGYMDFHLNKPEHKDAQLDFHRFVLLF